MENPLIRAAKSEGQFLSQHRINLEEIREVENEPSRLKESLARFFGGEFPTVPCPPSKKTYSEKMGLGRLRPSPT